MFPELPGSVVWLSVINFGCLPLIYFNMSSFFLLFSFFFWYSYYFGCKTICNCPTVLPYLLCHFLFLFHFFSFRFQFGKLLLTFFQVQWFLCWLFPVYWRAQQRAFFISVPVFFISTISFWFFYRIPSFYSWYSSLFAYYLFLY